MSNGIDARGVAAIQLEACRQREAALAKGHGAVHPPNTVYASCGKRVFDLLLGTIALILTSPIMLTAWLLVRITSPGKGLFSQDRIGLNGKPFKCYKLRSMYIDQDKRLDPKAHEQERDGVLVKMKDDPRVTTVGTVIRRTSIDELPQLFNVLNGTLSLVGPRPLVPHMLDPWPHAAAVRNQITPGITGLWQISSRSDNTSLGGMIVDDLKYVETLSFWTDCRIIMLTPFAVFKGEGAH